ncbi:MAG: hypothetical protein BEN19_00860 [Epulopiscium sp. Nuni2H_MBin003]|nr:MAG: hypothetical protein BEN19_00860 [Epulopiscium sp. Nuni2H_MBin003]
MQKLLEITYLFDLYHPLLTQKQKDLLAGYYFEDLSFSELAENYQISRQSIFDTIKKTEQKLLEFEQKLHLLEKFKVQQEILIELEQITTNEVNKVDKQDLLRIKYLIDKLKHEIL